ncbi:MAG TPA: GNAT family N-acetyltransferase, partial [Acidisoma sp.]|nr:GNAT family N-acetyltransferase [Acidisoma sp.]
MTEIVIIPLRPSDEVIDQLSDLLVETVTHGGSVSFMDPLSPDRAAEFWRASLAAAERGERVVFGAWDVDRLVGTLTLLTSLPENQPHRAEIAKMIVCVSYRGRGVASALLRAAETEARVQGRTHLMLDTASDGGAAALYERRGFVFAGEISDFALKPQGGLTGTRL